MGSGTEIGGAVIPGEAAVKFTEDGAVNGTLTVNPEPYTPNSDVGSTAVPSG